MTKGKADTVSKEAIIEKWKKELKRIKEYIRDAANKESRAMIELLYPKMEQVEEFLKDLNAYAQTESKWIGVEDGLPQHLLNVMVFYDDGITGYCSRGYWHSNPVVWDVSSYKGTIHPIVTHWQPLPTPPTSTTASKGGEEK